MTEQVLDPATQKIIDDFDAHAKKRFLEMLGVTESSPLQRTREISFCLGYKAGVIDLGAALREQSVVDVVQLAEVFVAACAWRNSSRGWPDVPDVHEARLIVAIDKARPARDIAFDDEYKRLSKTGACDGVGGMEWERVKAEWIAAGRPTEITIEAFIRKRANDLSGAES